MDILLSAVLGELTTRSVNFFISKYSRPRALDMEDRLRWVLLRAQVIIDEAMGRNITNQAMNKQLDMLRDAMHQGYYILDTFRYQHHNKDDVKDEIVSSLLSKINSVKDFCFSNGTSTKISDELQEVLDRLSSMVVGANELVMFLKSYPRLYRQPYSMHLLLGNCMFGRKMEAELVINFLLRTHPDRAEGLEVLPIVGPGGVGKSTLVAHVCKDERVRNQFSQIVFFSDHDVRDERVSLHIDGCTIQYQNYVSNKDRGLLVVVEVAEDLTEDAWKKWCSASIRCATNITKIIITSRSDKITKLGTTGAVTLKYLPNEAYWYFFKTLAFGSTDPEEYPRQAYLAMEITRMLNIGNLLGANITAYFLRDNFDVNFWCKVLAYLRGQIKKHVSKFGEHPCDLLSENRPAHIERMHRTSEAFVVYDQYQRSSQEEVPNMTLQDLVYGSVEFHGKFEVLAWRSQIPPYHSHVYACEIQKLKPTAAKRKRSMRNGVTFC